MNLKIKSNLLVKIIVAITLVLSLSACGGLGVNPMIKGASDELIFKKGHIEYNDDFEVPYIDYDEFFLKEGEENPRSGRYADLTEDGKFNWSVEETVRLEPTPIAKEMLSKVTLDGKKITLPMKFKDIGEEYAVFDKVDFAKLKDDMIPFFIEDKDTGNKLYLSSEHGEDYRMFELINKYNNFITWVDVNIKTNKIEGISTECGYCLGQKELLLDGIGTGNTLNEMYNKFGKPATFEGESDFLKYITYSYEDEYREYIIIFHYSKKIYNYKMGERQKVKNNNITSLFIAFEEK